MPSLTSLPLSLSEILEARGGPLKELEIWALLCQCAEALQDLIITGQAGGEDAFRHIITPNSLLVRDNGTIFLAEIAQDLSGSLYIAPELQLSSGQYLSDTAFEKMFAYSLGRTLQVASEFGLKENEVVSISYDLDSLLQAMSERNAALRLGLMHILEACALQASQHPRKPPHLYTLSRLYKTVLTDSTKGPFQGSGYGSNRSYQRTMELRPGRARRPRPHVRHRQDRKRSWSRSRSRSRSRSPSPKRDGHDSGFVTSSHRGSTPPYKVENNLHDMEATTSKGTHRIDTATMTSPTSQLLNTSLTTTASEHSGLEARYFQTPPYAAAQSVQGLLGLRQGSPAYQKYIQLKERQIRLRQARLGQAPTALHDVRSRLMTSPMLSHEMLDTMSETRSMASLMSYTLGTYKPDLHAQYGSSAALNYSKDTETETGSQLSLLFNSGDYGDALRAEETSASQTPFHTSPIWPPVEKQKQQQLQDHPKYDLQQQQDHLKHDQQQLQRQQPQQPTNAAVSVPSVKPAEVKSVDRKEFRGPEFVLRSRKPPMKVAMPLPGNNVKNVALLRKLTVVHLTGQKFEVVLDPNTTGRQLFDSLIPYIDLDDFFFFGLTYISEGEHFFLDADTKLHKIAPEGWKEEPKGHSQAVTFTLYVRVKFYPDSLTDFRHISSYHLLYLQLRKDIVEERVTCDLDTLSRLAGLALQAEYGDHSDVPADEVYFVPEHYLSSCTVRRLGATWVFNNAVREHSNCAGIPGSQAEIEYIKHVRHLPEYGIHFYKLLKVKSNSDNYIWVGLSQHSLVLAEPEPSGRSIVQDHPWNSILKISFNKRRFSVQPKVEVSRGKPPKMNFYTNSYRKGRYLLQFSTDQHRFQIRMRTRPSNMETLAGDMTIHVGREMAEAGVGDDVVGEDVVTEEAISLPPYVSPSLQALPENDVEDGDDDDDDFSESWTGKPAPLPEHPLQYRSPPPYQPPSMAKILGGLHVFPEVHSQQLHASMADLSNTSFDQHNLQTLLDMSSMSPGLDSALPTEENYFAESSPPYSSPVFIPRESQLGRHIFELTLEKEGHHGIGLTIVGGETTNSLDLGIFVKSVVAGGPADKDGRIKPGDRLIAIGGTSLEGKQHHEAVTLIKDGGPKITLLVSQIRPPATIKKHSTHNDQAEFERKLRSSMLDYSNKNGYDSLLAENNFNGSSLETFLHFDDVIRTHSDIYSNNVHNSDKGIYPSEPVSRESQLPLVSSSLTYHHHASHPEDGSKTSTSVDQHMLSKHTQANIQHKTSTVEQVLEDGVYDLTVDQLDSPYSSNLNPSTWDPHYMSEDPGEGGDQEVPENDTFLKLKEDEDFRLQFDKGSMHWPSEELVRQREQFYKEGLTEKDKEDLQMLGDIAALDADDSSSDSDFDSAVKKTIEGSSRKIGSNAASSLIIRRPSGSASSEFPPMATDVIYEVILEKNQSSSLGILTCMSSDPHFPRKGVFIKEILPGSSADRGGVLAPGDRIIEVAGQNVEIFDSSRVQALLDSVLDLITVKVSRPIQRDSVVTSKLAYKDDNELFHCPDWGPLVHPHLGERAHRSKPLQDTTNCAQIFMKPRAMSISQLIPPAPREKTEPLDENLYIVPPPPPALVLQDSESNTQSDVDSDVLDSSRSELESIHNNALLDFGAGTGKTLKVTAPEVAERNSMIAVEKESTEKLVQETPGNVLDDGKCDTDKLIKHDPEDSFVLDTSTEFNEKLSAMKKALDDRAGKNLSPTHSSASTDSLIRSPRKAIEKREKSMRLMEERQKSLLLLGQTRLRPDSDEDPTEHDDDDDVVVTMYGNEPATGKDADTLDLRSPSTEESSKEDISTVKVKDGAKILEEQAIKKSKDLFEPEILEVVLKKKGGSGFGFTVAGGVTTGGCYIKQLVSDPAVSDGRLRPGDRIVKVNGTDTTVMSHVEAVSLLRNLSDVANMQILRCPSSLETQHDRQSFLQSQAKPQSAEPVNLVQPQTSEEGEVKKSVKDIIKSLDGTKTVIQPYVYKKPDLPHHDGEETIVEEKHEMANDGPDGSSGKSELEVLTIELIKPDTLEAGLGISLMKRVIDGQSGIFVKRLRVGGTADRDGRLQEGDRILQTNGVNFIGMDEKEAVAFLKEVKGKVVLTVTRPGNRRLSEVYDEDSDDYDTGLHITDEDINSLAQEAASLLYTQNENEQENLETSKRNNYVSPRTPAIDVPVILSREWLMDLPLMFQPRDKDKESTIPLLRSLTALVEGGEPNEEFKNLHQIKDTGSCDVGKLPENKSKNRYRNVLPYDENRVKLQNHPGDYINASYIKMQVGHADLRYIAAQGPEANTISDFWAMVWQEQVAVVAMLTQVMEEGKLKCQPYWPQAKDDVLQTDDGILVIRQVRSYQLEDFVVMQVTIRERSSGSEREVTVLQYSTWPDHSVPLSALPLLKLLQVVHLLEKGSPPIIHCSAGLGRTGTFIAIDVALATIEQGLEVDFYEIVKKLRAQRHGMIQTTEQYLFCYTACMEVLLSIVTESD